MTDVYSTRSLLGVILRGQGSGRVPGYRYCPSADQNGCEIYTRLNSQKCATTDTSNSRSSRVHFTNLKARPRNLNVQPRPPDSRSRLHDSRGAAFGSGADPSGRGAHRGAAAPGPPRSALPAAPRPPAGCQGSGRSEKRGHHLDLTIHHTKCASVRPPGPRGRAPKNRKRRVRGSPASSLQRRLPRLRSPRPTFSPDSSSAEAALRGFSGSGLQGPGTGPRCL